MAGPTLLGTAQALHILVVIRFEVRLIHGNALLNAGKVQQHIFDAGLFRCLEKLFVGLVELINLRIGWRQF